MAPLWEILTSLEKNQPWHIPSLQKTTEALQGHLCFGRVSRCTNP